MLTDVYQDPALNTKEVDVVNVNQRWSYTGRVDKRSMKYRPSTLQGREDYMANNLYLADREMDKMFNEDR